MTNYIEQLDHLTLSDIRELLARRKTIGLFFDIGRFDDIRPDLADDQRWHVLKDVEQRYNRELFSDELFWHFADEHYRAPAGEEET